MQANYGIAIPYTKAFLDMRNHSSVFCQYSFHVEDLPQTKQVDSSLSKNQLLISQTTVIIYYHYNYIAINIQ